jgi:hypothetical protein
MTTDIAGEIRLPGIGRSLNGRIKERDVARAAREGDSVPEDACGVSYLTVADCCHPFGIFSDIDPRDLSERLRNKLTGCIHTFLRRCGRRMSRSGNARTDRNDARPEELTGSLTGARLSSRQHGERAS